MTGTDYWHKLYNTEQEATKALPEIIIIITNSCYGKPYTTEVVKRMHGDKLGYTIKYTY
jgi:hypothetical protein